jgi:hypothetical protein
MLRRLCGRGFYLRDGSLCAVGAFKPVQQQYLGDVHVEE